jgi:histidinol dehydrogenase
MSTLPSLLRWADLDADAQRAALARPPVTTDADSVAAVQRILDQVRADGDVALRALTRRFDGVELGGFVVSEAEFAAASASVPAEVQQAMREARERLIAWHRAGTPAEFSLDTAEGVRCGRVLRPIATVGLYVPAGSAPLPSTALMLGVPAELAGCPNVVLCTPPRADGSADPAVLVAAQLSGVRTVLKLGGAQAIAAMAFGTASVPRCDKLFGPGNRWVTLAKQQVSALPDGPAIDMPAGPSEVLVIADGAADPRFVAADLLAQAEHGPDSQVLLLSDSASLLAAVQDELPRQLARLPRGAIAGEALRFARLILCASLDEAVALSNRYGPEHLIVNTHAPERWLPAITCAGSIFLGAYAPESLGDYCSGTNHVLPTGGAARAWSGVSVSSFQRSISVQSVSREGLRAIGPCAVTLARTEGLEAHAQAVVVRLEASA